MLHDQSATGPDATHGARQATSRRLLALLLRVPPLAATLMLLTSRPYLVRGASMEPTLQDGDHVLASRLPYIASPPRRGDVVVLVEPRRQPPLIAIKRIAGLPGELVRPGPSGVEARPPAAGELPRPHEWLLEPGEFFVVGDNPAPGPLGEESIDSRRYGPVTLEHILGKVWCRYLPWPRRGRIRP